MKKLNYLLPIFFFGTFLFSCSGFVINDKLIGNYSLIAVDEDEELSLCYCRPDDNNNGCIPLIAATVFEVGYNKDHIIVKQHPRTFPNPPDKNKTNFYILPINHHLENLKNDFLIIGPLTFDQFNEKRKELNIPETLRFTIIKKNLK